VPLNLSEDAPENPPRVFAWRLFVARIGPEAAEKPVDRLFKTANRCVA